MLSSINPIHGGHVWMGWVMGHIYSLGVVLVVVLPFWTVGGRDGY